MDFKNFIEDYRKLKQSEKNLLNKNKNRYYDQIRIVLENSKLFERTDPKKTYRTESYESKEKISFDYIGSVKEFRKEPYHLPKLEVSFGNHEEVPDYDVFGKRRGVKKGKPILDLRIQFNWKKKYIHVEKGWFSNKEKEVYDYETYNSTLTYYSSWKGGIIKTIERKTNKSYLSESEKEVFFEIENIFNKTTIEILEEKQKTQNEIEQKKRDSKKKLDTQVDVILNKLDKNNDGIIDSIQGQDDFLKLLKKHQKTIIKEDKTYITKLVQISDYLKTKKENIQIQFENIQRSKNQKDLKDQVGVLKNQIDTYNLLNYNSLLMIISIVENDLITFNEIYLTFDRLNIFDSNWEKEVYKKLNKIEMKINDLIFSINKMEQSIVHEILKMSIMNQVNLMRINKNIVKGNQIMDQSLSSLNKSLSSNLKSINSSVKVNNLLTLISTYQTYKINKNTKSLRG